MNDLNDNLDEILKGTGNYASSSTYHADVGVHLDAISMTGEFTLEQLQAITKAFAEHNKLNKLNTAGPFKNMPEGAKSWED